VVSAVPGEEISTTGVPTGKKGWMSAESESGGDLVKSRLQVWLKVVLLCAGSLLIGSCGPIKKVRSSIERAITVLQEESRLWQSTLTNLEKDIRDDAESAIANEVQSLLNRGIGTAGVELRCDIDFVGKRMTQGLRRILAELDGAPPEALIPGFCQVDPTSVDLNLVAQGRLKSLNIYGYDMYENNKNDSPLRVYLRDRNGVEVAISGNAVAMPTHYLMTIQLNDPSIHLNSLSEKIVIKYGLDTLSTISIQPRSLVQTDYCVPDVPPLIGTESFQSCYLTRLTGSFLGPSDAVATVVSAGSWYLTGTSSKNDVCATGVCDTGYRDSGVRYTWSLGRPPVKMAAVKNNACFLTLVKGRLYNSNEFVRISANPDGYYYLSGGAQPGVDAEARCVLGVAWSQSFTWTTGQNTLPLGEETSRMCFLTEVAGQFLGRGDAVRTYFRNGSWYLDGLTQHAGVKASAVCIPS